MRDSDQYAARADSARADADAATLDNVRDRCLRAEKAWRDMAERSQRVESARDTRVAAQGVMAQPAPVAT